VTAICWIDALQELYTLQLLLQSFARSKDIIYFSFGRWHSNNCQGIDSSYGQALESVGRFLQVGCANDPGTCILGRP
jgi:hypothetical protein